MLPMIRLLVPVVIMPSLTTLFLNQVNFPEKKKKKKKKKNDQIINRILNSCSFHIKCMKFLNVHFLNFV